jgi:hypothetical protein
MSKIDAHAYLLHLLAELERLTKRDVIDWSAAPARAIQQRLFGLANAIHLAAPGQ